MLAAQNPWRMFTVKELATMLTVSPDSVYAAKKKGAPFPFNRGRPEWLIEWMRENHSSCTIK
jgi:hypothetical protein